MLSSYEVREDSMRDNITVYKLVIYCYKIVNRRL